MSEPTSENMRGFDRAIEAMRKACYGLFINRCVDLEIYLNTLERVVETERAAREAFAHKHELSAARAEGYRQAVERICDVHPAIREIVPDKLMEAPDDE